MIKSILLILTFIASTAVAQEEEKLPEAPRQHMLFVGLIVPGSLPAVDETGNPDYAAKCFHPAHDITQLLCAPETEVELIQYARENAFIEYDCQKVDVIMYCKLNQDEQVT